ncbi:MAG: hypothetical protein KME28_22025 [Pelatocladus maniniholoensis HA4357-MV3]|jgi:hypothetical protein|uniref:Uncharacterized protein n=1 Tax=Pelatocladus maniniholoensis HA4357-MV3 TaxID=1117104 RepID=A0A9E3HBY8_9NOST|nr:hypothetical protein [Pelatocladus maniniholoensis HA4357-MV3]
MSVRINFIWRYQPRNQHDVRLMQYIKDNQVSSKTEMLLLALRSFWLPYALVEDCSSSKEQMRGVTHSAVQVLRRQVKDILELVGLEDAPQTIQSLIATRRIEQMESGEIASAINKAGFSTIPRSPAPSPKPNAATSLPYCKTSHSSMFSFYWRYQPRNQYDVRLMQYIQDNQISSKTEMLLLALRSFWLPYALVEDSSSDSEQMRGVAHSAVQALRRQVKDILELVGLEDAPQTIQSPPIAISLPCSKTPQSSTPSLDTLRHLAGEYAYDDTGLVDFL